LRSLGFAVAMRELFVMAGQSLLPNVHQFPDGSQIRDVVLMPQKCTSMDKYQKGVLRLSSVRRRHLRFYDWMMESCASPHGMGPVRSHRCVTGIYGISVHVSAFWFPKGSARIEAL
jgi:hypothetical protein